MVLESYNGPQLDDVTPPPRDFDSLSKEDCIEAVTTWFFENFEDPVHHDSYISAEGGYQYIWGGPYDASEILWEAFEGHLPPEIIEEAIEDIQSDGTFDWTSANRRVQPPEPELEEDPVFSFREMKKRISELEDALAKYQERPAGIGHNGPPEPIEEEPLDRIDIQNITINIKVLKSQEPYKVNEKEKVNKALGQLDSISKKLGAYFARKGDLFIDEAVKAAGAELGKRAIQAGTAVGAAYAIYEILEKLLHSANHWANMVF